MQDIKEESINKKQKHQIKQVTKKVLYLICKSFCALILFAFMLFIGTSISPIYNFQVPKPFNGNDIFNPYNNLDTMHCWKRANFHVHTRIRSCVFYVSDHGESLGENNLYMHGVPMMMAPAEQIEIPFIVWTSDSTLTTKSLKEIGQYHVFHSVLHFLGIESPIYDENYNIFE